MQEKNDRCLKAHLERWIFALVGFVVRFSFVRRRSPGSQFSSLRAERPQEPAAPSTGLLPRTVRPTGTAVKGVCLEADRERWMGCRPVHLPVPPQCTCAQQPAIKKQEAEGWKALILQRLGGSASSSRRCYRSGTTANRTAGKSRGSKKSVFRDSCLVIRENHGRGPGSLQKKCLSAGEP